MNKMLLVGAVALAGLSLTACGDDDDKNSVNPMDAYIEALDAMHPYASRNATWERKSGYIVADFRNASGFDTEVWFMPSNAVWVMTVTEGESLAEMPPVVKDAFTSGPYSQWTVDDIDYYERPDTKFYIFEVEKTGEKDMNVYYTADGELLKVVASSTDVDILPTTQII